MTTRNELVSADKRARIRMAKPSKVHRCCQNRFCTCDTSQQDDHGDHLTAVDVNNIVLDLAEQLGWTDPTEAKLIAENCIQVNQNTPLTEEMVKEIAVKCDKTTEEIQAIIAAYLLDKGCGLNSEAVKSIFDICFADIDIPDGVTDAHIKAVVLQCILNDESIKDYIAGLVAAGKPDPINVEQVVLEILISQNLTEAGIKAIFDDCIVGAIPDDEHIKTVFIKCLEDWEISPDCIKDFVYKCLLEYLPDPVTKADLKCFIDECYGSRLHTRADIQQCVLEELIRAPKRRSDEEIVAIIDQTVTDDRIKAGVLLCLNQLGGKQWTETELLALIESVQRSDEQLKAFIDDCVDVPSQELIEQIASTQALIHINNLPPGLDENDVKAVFVDCLKNLTATTINDVDLEANCQDGNLNIGVSVNGVTGSDSVPLSKFGSGSDLTFCMSYSPNREFFPIDGKVKIPVKMKVNRWDGGFEHVDYDPVNDCLEAPYVGPAKQDINDCIVTALADFEGGTGGVTPEQAKNIAQACINLLGPRLSYCLQKPVVDQEGSTVTVTLPQENCATPAQFSFNVSADGTVECCNDNLVITGNGTTFTATLSQTAGPDVSDTFTVNHPTPPSQCINSFTSTVNGSRVTIDLNQDNCPDQTTFFDLPQYCITGTEVDQVGQVVTVTQIQQNCPDPIQFSFTVGGDGGTVDCCNTSFSPTTFDPETCIITGTLNQSVGAPVTISIPLADYFTAPVVDDPDGCSQFASFRIGNKELVKLPIYTPKQCCLKYCVTYEATTEETITFDTASGFTWSWENNDESITGDQGSATGGSLTQSFEPGTYEFTVCQNNACEKGDPPIFTTNLPTSKHDCGC